MTAPGAIVIGGYANGASALRGLARAGVHTAVTLTKSQAAQHLDEVRRCFQSMPATMLEA